MPRLFNTSDIGNITYGDPDLGSPNEGCGGPGVGIGGAPGMLGENCVPQGNVLIIQESNAFMEQPDDNAFGGTIIFDFTPQAETVYAVGVMDIDGSDSKISVEHGDGSTSEPKTIHGLGENSVQTIPVNLENVSRLSVFFPGSGAVTSISFCHRATQPDTALPGAAPTDIPSRAPST